MLKVSYGAHTEVLTEITISQVLVCCKELKHHNLLETLDKDCDLHYPENRNSFMPRCKSFVYCNRN